MNRFFLFFMFIVFPFQLFALSEAELTYLEGNAYLQAKDYQGALACYEKTISLEKDFIPAWQMKYVALDKLARGKEADECLQKVLELKGRDIQKNIPLGLYLRASGLANIGEYAKALTAFDEALAKDLGRYRVLALYEKADVLLYGFSKYTEAIIWYDKSIAVDPANKRAWHSKGYAEAMLGSLENALACFNKAIENDAKDASLWQNKAIMLFSLKRYEDALTSFDKSITLFSKNAVVWEWKGKTLQALGRTEEAEKCFAFARTLIHN